MINGYTKMPNQGLHGIATKSAAPREACCYTLWKKAQHLVRVENIDTLFGGIGVAYLHQDTQCLLDLIRVRQMSRQMIRLSDDV
jgi:hypothetical protein